MRQVGVEVVLPRRAHPQPIERCVALGDCGACVLGGLMGISVPEAYDYVRSGTPSAIGWQEMRGALESGEALGRFERVLTDVPFWPHAAPVSQTSWGLAPKWQQRPWWAMATTAIDAGLYGLGCVRFDAMGVDADGVNHWVLIAGYRNRMEEVNEGTTRIHTELLVSCSARYPSGFWVDRKTFLSAWGGFNTLWARPA